MKSETRESEHMFTGKLTPEALSRSVFKSSGAHRPEVLVGPAVGEDAAVIRWPEGKFMVFSSDPIVGAVKGAGKLLVRVNINDIASKGGEPAFITVTMIMPPEMGEGAISAIMDEIHYECLANNIAVVGGHTEFNDCYAHPVLSASLVGTADRVFRAENIKEGDVIFVSKHIGIEGMAILASDRPELLEQVLTAGEIEEVRGWMEHTSVLAESRLLREHASFMHDPTEGGFYGGLGEICRLASLSADIDEDTIPLHPYTKKAASGLGFKPLRFVASGSIMALVPEEKAGFVERRFANADISLTRVGHMTKKESDSVCDFGELTEELWGLLKREILK